MDYKELLKHPEWQKKRLEIMNFHEWTCQECGARDVTLHVHHPYYKKGAKPWEYDLHELQCLCENCHQETHELDEQIKMALAGCEHKRAVLSYIASLKYGGDLRSINADVDQFKAEWDARYPTNPMPPREERTAEIFFERIERLLAQ